MPGLAALKAAKPGEIAISYRDVDGGAERTYWSNGAHLVDSLHSWFDAQLADHGADAMEGGVDGFWPKVTAGSIDRRNTGPKFIRRSLECQSLSRALIQSQCNFIQIGLTVVREVCAFLEVLPQ